MMRLCYILQFYDFYCSVNYSHIRNKYKNAGDFTPHMNMYKGRKQLQTAKQQYLSDKGSYLDCFSLCNRNSPAFSYFQTKITGKKILNDLIVLTLL